MSDKFTPGPKPYPLGAPHFHRVDLLSRIQQGSGGRPWAKADPCYREPPTAPCKPYGGDCIGDGCIHWFPLPSPARCQEATCDLGRAGQPIHQREARRKLLQQARLGNEATRLGWLGSAQVAFQRAWAWAYTVTDIEERAAVAQATGAE